MGTTANRGYPYPEGSEQPQVHLDIKAALEAVDVDMLALLNRVGGIVGATASRTTDDDVGSVAGSVTSVTLTGCKTGQLVAVIGVLRSRQNASAGNQSFVVAVGGTTAGSYILGSVAVQTQDHDRTVIGMVASPTDNPSITFTAATSAGTLSLRSGSRLMAIALPLAA